MPESKPLVDTPFADNAYYSYPLTILHTTVPHFSICSNLMNPYNSYRNDSLSTRRGIWISDGCDALSDTQTHVAGTLDWATQTRIAF